MGWYGDHTICPNCRSEKATEMFRNSMLESYYLVCTDCGLHLYAEHRQWVISNSYIDESVIGKNPEDVDPSEMVDEDKNEDIISKGTVL